MIAAMMVATLTASAQKEAGSFSVKPMVGINFANVTGSLTINASAFESSKVSSITWPTASSCKVKINNSGAFKNCDNLTTITIPANFDGDLGSSTFEDCDNLKSIKLGYNIESVGSQAFKSCDSLEKVVIYNEDTHPLIYQKLVY